MNLYRVKKIRLQSGERLPVLVAVATGVPLWNPTIFTVTALRATNRASATIEQALRSIMVAHQIFDYLGIDIDARLEQGRLLDIGEIDTLADYAGVRQDGLTALLPSTQGMTKWSENRNSLEKARMRITATNGPPRICAEGTAIRLIYIRNYLRWLARRALLRSDPRQPFHASLASNSECVIEQLSARIPALSRQEKPNARQGISPELRARLLSVIHPDAAENPWRNKHVRIRNQLVIRWLLELGLRRGELLGVRLEDIDLRMNEVKVRRRPDDPEETRGDSPQNKGRNRDLAMGEGLAELTRTYVLGPRRSIRGARRNPYLFVATGTGKPLSKSAISKMFVELRNKALGDSEELSSHVLRHTWNDEFSELMDRLGIHGDEEQKIRSQQMGWSDRSQMAVTYTRRHVRRKANEASLALQAASFDAERGKR